MKKQLLLPGALCLLLMMTAFLAIKHPTATSLPTTQSPVGRWERTLPNGGVWVWSIRPNGTFSVSSKGKDFANGHYRLKNGIYDVNDANCNDAYHGHYRFTFFAKDSLKFTVIDDTCRRRRGGMDGTGWKRLPDAK